MFRITDIPPEILKNRHGLSSQQINSLYDRTVLKEKIEEKTLAFEIIRELILLTDTFRIAGIEFISLKGPLLSYRIYGDPTTRSFSDLDIMVKIPIINPAVQILLKLGYRYYDIVWPDQNSTQKLLIKLSNHIAFIHSKKQIVIELHWRIIRTLPIRFEQFEELVDRNKININFANRSFSVFSNELELLFLIIHGGLHFWNRLKWLVDVNSFLQNQTFKWEQFSDLKNELKSTRLVALFNTINAAVFPDSPKVVPYNLKASPSLVRISMGKIREEAIPEHYSFKEFRQSLLFSMIAFPGIGYKVRTLKSSMFANQYFGRNSFFNKPPFIYFYIIFKLVSNHLKQ